MCLSVRHNAWQSLLDCRVADCVTTDGNNWEFHLRSVRFHREVLYIVYVDNTLGALSPSSQLEHNIVRGLNGWPDLMQASLVKPI